MNCVYVLVDPNTDEARYVGVTTNPTTRLHNHFSADNGTPVCLWARQLRSAGGRPTLHVLEEGVPDSEVVHAEEFWIQNLRCMGARLLNVGMNPDMSPNRQHRDPRKPATDTLHLRLPKTELDKLSKMAASQDRSKSYIAAKVITEWLAAH